MPISRPKRENLREQIVPDKHAGFVAPDEVSRRLAATHRSRIDHIIMDKRCCVHQFNSGGAQQRALSGTLRVFTAQLRR
jgi:hypothetical protein